MKQNLGKLGGRFHVECYDKNGNLRWKEDITNGITNVGKNKLLDVMFHADTPVTTWYIGLVDNAGFTAFADADTMASHAGWSEFTAYSESTRVEWTEGAAASQQITNASPVSFSINASGTVHGIFVVSDSTKSGTTGILWATAALAANRAVNNGDSLKITYTVGA